MNKPQRERGSRATRRSGAAQTLALFIRMAIEEWWKLVADVTNAFAGRGGHAAGKAIFEEKRFGDQ